MLLSFSPLFTLAFFTNYRALLMGDISDIFETFRFRWSCGFRGLWKFYFEWCTASLKMFKIHLGRFDFFLFFFLFLFLCVHELESTWGVHWLDLNFIKRWEVQTCTCNKQKKVQPWGKTPVYLAKSLYTSTSSYRPFYRSLLLFVLCYVVFSPAVWVAFKKWQKNRPDEK